MSVASVIDYSYCDLVF